MSWLWIVVIGMGVGFVSGLFGKGASAIATPLLHLAGVPALIALAAPLPATIPSTLAAGAAYWRGRFIDHGRLGHIDWTLVLVFGAASIPLAYLGARVALRTEPARLERLYGAALLALGIVLLVAR